MSVSAFDIRFWCGSSASHSEQPGQSREVVRGHCQDEARSDAFNASIHGLSHAPDGFRPAERLFDLLAVLLGQSVALVPGGSAVDC